MTHPLQIAAMSVAFLALSVLIAAAARRFMRPPTDDDLAAEQMAQAKRLHLEHEALAEQHQATAGMYARRVYRLEQRSKA